jgi:putative nucleotidyltransferase with HDIG domain
LDTDNLSAQICLPKQRTIVMPTTSNVGITRSEALGLMKQYLPQDNLRKHSLATEAIMRALARKLGYNEEQWGIAGLLHDLDYDTTKDRMDQHTLETKKILDGLGINREIIEAIKGHNADNLGFQRNNTFEHALTAAECITGMIVATTLVYPDKKLASVKPKSILKRMKQKEFARNVNRDFIRECEKLGISLEDFASLSLQAMCAISDDLGL